MRYLRLPYASFTLLTVIFVFVLVLGVRNWAEARAEEPVDMPREHGVIFETPIGAAGQSLVVTTGPYVNPTSFAGVVRASLPEFSPRYYEVRVELRVPGQESVLLAARLRGESGPENDRGSVVLDSLIERGQAILFVAEGPGLFLWQIGIPGSARMVHLKADKPWMKAAAAYRLDEKLIGAKLGRSDDGRLTVEVLEKLSGYHNQFEEVEKDTLRFKLVRQWKGESK